MIKTSFVRFVKRHYLLYSIAQKAKSLLRCLNGGGVKIENKGIGKLVVDSIGSDNKIIVHDGTVFSNTRIRIRGTNNTIEFGKDCIIGSKCSFWMEGNNISIKIGANTTFTHTVHFCAQEDNSSIIIGSDCMFSNTIIVRTSDSHPIYDLKTKERLNPPKSVMIGNHVWIAPGSKIMKGAEIGDGAIIGSNSMITKRIPSNVLAVGMPSRVVKENIYWTRDKLF